MLIHPRPVEAGIAAGPPAKAAKAEVHGTAYHPKNIRKLAPSSCDRAIDYRRDGWWQIGPMRSWPDALAHLAGGVLYTLLRPWKAGWLRISNTRSITI